MNLLCVIVMTVVLGADPIPPAHNPTLNEQLVAAIEHDRPALIKMERERYHDTTVMNPAFNRGVGYSPIIVTLPEGTNMGATAVVSSDRRYVRFSTSPTVMFSSIPQWSSFNMQTGQTVVHKR